MLKLLQNQMFCVLSGGSEKHQIYQLNGGPSCLRYLLWCLVLKPQESLLGTPKGALAPSG